MLKGKQLIELSYDIQTGLGIADVPDFDTLRTMGMAATLAVHLRGLGEINYEVLRKVSSHFFSIPTADLKPALQVLAELEYVKLIQKGSRIESVIPQVPRFRDLYEGVGEYFTFSELNEHEQATLMILSQLQNKPENKDRLVSSIGLESDLMSRCLEIGEYGRYFKSFRARERDIVASPFYFADNLEELVDISTKCGADDIAVVVDIIKRNQGWPLSLIEKNLELGGQKLSATQKELLVKLCSEGVLKPPSIQFRNAQESFVFTPRPGGVRLDAENREIYERAMALVACVRKGQLLADAYRIKYPVAILRALKDRGYLRASSEASSQYRNLVDLRVGHLKHVGGEKYQFHLIKTEENNAALDLSISLLQTGELRDLEVNQEAKIALSKDETYIQSLISSAELKKRESLGDSREAAEQFEQLILEY